MNDTAPPEPQSPPSGHCLCGAVSYEVHGPMRPVWNCHCWRCRRWTGHYLATSHCRQDHLHFVTDGALAWHRPADDPNVAYGFCRECGSSLFWKVTEGAPEQIGRIAVCAGTLDLPTGLHTERAVFVADAADYHTPNPNIESWDRE